MKPVLFKSKITFKDNTIDEYCNIECYVLFEKLSGLQRLTSGKGILVSFCELSNKGYVVKKRYCFHKLAYLYEGYRVKKENGVYVPCCGSKSMFNMEYFESDAGCFVMTFFDKKGNRVEYYTKNLDDIDGLDDYYAEKYGCLSFYVRCYGSPVFLFDRVMQVNENAIKYVHEKEFNQYTAIICYLSFYGVKYRSCRLADCFGAMLTMHFTFENINDLDIFREIIRKMLWKYYEKKELEERVYHLKYIQNDYFHFALKK